MDLVEKALAGGHWPGVTLVQVTLIAALGVLAWAAARRRGPALRGAVVLAALVGLLAVPALAAVAPVWLPLSALAHADPAPEPPEPRAAVRVPPLPRVETPATTGPAAPEPAVKLPPGMAEEPLDPFEEALLAEMAAEQGAAEPPRVAVGTPPVVEPVKPRRAAPSAASILVTVWLAGVVFCLARALVCLALLYRSAWRARPIPEAEWAACLGPADREDRPRVWVRESREVGSPLTLGLLRPVILLPRAWRDWSAGQLRLVLAHELAHVRRRDFLAGLAAELAVCVCWFHPVVRWLAGRLRLEQEYAADARAASVAGDAMTYVRCLARLALEQGTGRRAPAPALWRRRPEILRRIDMLRRNRDGLSRRVGWGAAGAVVVLAAAACVAVAGVGPLRVIPGVPEIFDTIPAGAPEEVPVAAGAARDAHGDPLPAGATARLGTNRWRQGSNITYIAYGADDKTLITAAQDGTVRLWDMTTGQEIRRFARPAPAGQPVPQPVPVPPARPGGAGAGATPAPVAQPVVVQKAALEAQVVAEKARAEAAEARAALSAARARLDAAKPGAEADDAKKKLEAAQAAEQAARAKVEAARAQLEVQLRQLQQGGPVGTTPVVAVSADGKTLAVAGGNVVQLYEVQTGKELRKIEGVTVGLVALLFSPDGKTLAGRGSDSSVTLWETDTAKERQKIKPPARQNDRTTQVVAARVGNDTPGISFTPDSKSVIVVTTEFKDQMVTSAVKFWSVSTGEEVRDLKGPLGPVSAVAISPNGKTLVYVSGPVLRAFDMGSADALYETRLSAPTAALVFSPDGKRLAVAGRGQPARVYDAADGKELYSLGEAQQSRVIGGGVVLAGALPLNPEVRTLAFSPDGKSIATATGGTLRLWTAADGKEKSLSQGHSAPLVAVVVSPDGKTAVTYAADRLVCRWDAATGKLLDSFRAPADTGAVTLSPDGKTAARSTTDGTIHIHETAGGKEVHQFKGAPRGASALVYSPDGTVLAERGTDGVIRLYDPAKGAELRPLAAQASNPQQAEFVAVAAAQVRSFGGVGSGSGLVFSPDGKLLASSGSASPAVLAPTPAGGRPARPSGAAISLYDVSTGKVIRKIEPTVGAVSFSFSPDGRVLAAENTDGSVSLFEVVSGKERARLGQVAAPAAVQGAPGLPGVVAVGGGGFGPVAQPAAPTAVAFSPDGRMLVVRGADRSVRAWEVDGGKEVGKFQGHDGRVETVAFSADGKCVATGSADTTVLLWDAAALRKDMPERVAAELPDGMTDTLWADLGGEDAGKALKAVLGLSGDPKHAVPVLAERLKPAAPIDPQKLEQWVADLESGKFAVRQEASANLVKAGELVVPALQKVLTSQPTIETRKRVEALLDKLTGGVLTSEQLRLVRAVEALERMGTSEAREVLRTLAGGAAGALPTREARAALDRTGGR